SFVPVSIKSGAIFTITGGTLSNNSSPTITFGFATSNTPILLTNGQMITGIEQLGLVQHGTSGPGNSATISAGFQQGGAPVLNFNGLPGGLATWIGEPLPGALFPFYNDGGMNFGNGDFLQEANVLGADTGRFLFNGIQTDSSDPILFGAHVRF